MASAYNVDLPRSRQYLSYDYDKTLMNKVVPMFNVMQHQDLTIEDGIAFVEIMLLVRNREASNELSKIIPEPIEDAVITPLTASPVDTPAPSRKKTSTKKIFKAKRGQTVVQELRRLYEERPFDLIIKGVTISITKEMSLIDATVHALAVMRHAEKSLVKQAPQPAAPVEATPESVAPVAAKPEPAAADDSEDDDAQPQLPVIKANPGESLSKATARAWAVRPCVLEFSGHTIDITPEMSLVDAQISAADITGVNGNIEVDNDVVNSFICPVDDSAFNVSMDRFSGAPIVRTVNKCWLDDYPYRISCEPFDDYMAVHPTIYVHCRERPTQALFDVYYKLYQQHTHKVHVRMSNFMGDGSSIITQEYCSWRPREGGNFTSSARAVTSVREHLGENVRWEDGARYRIKYWDEEIRSINHKYFTYKPTLDVVRELHHPRLKAYLQTRPAHL